MTVAPSGDNPRAQGQTYLESIRAKLDRLVEEFSTGQINRTQFHQVYDRYQRQIMAIEQLIAEEDPTAWQDALTEGEDTIHIRRRLTAQPLGLGIYDNESGVPIEALGEFAVETDQIAAILTSYRSAATQVLPAGLRSAQMENGLWLCFVPGELSTLVALFSLEPADSQLRALQQMHRDFESANRAALSSHQADPATLAYPFLSLLKNSAAGADSAPPESAAG